MINESAECNGLLSRRMFPREISDANYCGTFSVSSYNAKNHSKLRRHLRSSVFIVSTKRHQDANRAATTTTRMLNDGVLRRFTNNKSKTCYSIAPRSATSMILLGTTLVLMLLAPFCQALDDLGHENNFVDLTQSPQMEAKITATSANAIYPDVATTPRQRIRYQWRRSRRTPIPPTLHPQMFDQIRDNRKQRQELPQSQEAQSITIAPNQTTPTNYKLDLEESSHQLNVKKSIEMRSGHGGNGYRDFEQRMCSHDRKFSLSFFLLLSIFKIKTKTSKLPT